MYTTALPNRSKFPRSRTFASLRRTKTCSSSPREKPLLPLSLSHSRTKISHRNNQYKHTPIERAAKKKKKKRETREKTEFKNPSSSSSSIMEGSTEYDEQHSNIHSQTPISIGNSPMSTQNQDNSVEPTDLLSMLHLYGSTSSAATCYCHQHRACASGGSLFNSNSMKRRSPCSSSGEPCAKKILCDHDDLSLHGFTTITLPLTLGTLAKKNENAAAGPVLRRCVSDPSKPPAAGVPANSPERVNGGNPATPVRECGLPPLPPSLTRCVSDLSPSPAKAIAHSLSSEETPESMRLRRMKDRLKEMRQWWDEVIREEEEEEQEEDCLVAEDDKISLPPQEDLKGDSEEAVRVEWAEKCVSISFRCPCGKGYEVLLSANNCYYKLV